MKYPKTLPLFTILMLCLSATLADKSIAKAPLSSLRKATTTEEQTSRELSFASGWSFTNLLFKAGVCHTPASTCPDYSSNMCGCPRCDKKLIPPHLHSYCKMVKSRSHNNGGSSSGSGSGSSSYNGGNNGGANGNGGGGEAAYQADGGESYGYYNAGGEGYNGGNDEYQQYQDRNGVDEKTNNSTVVFKPLILVILGTMVVAMAAGAFMKNRISAFGAGKDLDNDDDEATTAYSLADESQQGIVSRRLGLLNSGADLNEVNAVTATPGFVRVPSAMTGIETTITESEKAIEIQGPYSPSSYM